MIKWLQARQNGVTRARNQWLSEIARNNPKPTGNVYLAAEVNLVNDCVRTSCKRMVQTVIPYVALDMVSYSSYDTEYYSSKWRDPKTSILYNSLKDALQEIINRHNRTQASPPSPAVFIAEWGSGSWGTSDIKMMANVLDTSITMDIKYVMFWNVFTNECNSQCSNCNGGRCNWGPPYITDPACLKSYWLQMPNGTYSPQFHEMKSRIQASKN